MKLDKRVDTSGLIGATGMGLCPALVASALASIGLGVLTPIWVWLSAGILALGLAGFWLDFQQHRKIGPLLLFSAGSILLFVGRHTRYGGIGWEAWEIWGPGALFVVAAFLRNLRLRPKACRRPSNTQHRS